MKTAATPPHQSSPAADKAALAKVGSCAERVANLFWPITDVAMVSPPLDGFLCNVCGCTFLCQLSHATTPTLLACSLTHNSHSWLLVSPFTHVPLTPFCRPCFSTRATALSTDGTFGDSPSPGVGNRQKEHARQRGPQPGCSC